MRLYFIVEGQTEETFVNQVLKPHLATQSIWASATCVTTSRRKGIVYRGGVTTYQHPKRDITFRMREDQNSNARFTTMLDLYRLPYDFPGHEKSIDVQDPYQRVKILEEALRDDISDPRFIPYIQIHEFESLLLTDPQKLDGQFYSNHSGIHRLVTMANEFASPELINDGQDTAPSIRIAREIPEYPRMKASAGPITASAIGLPALRAKCRHFNEWLSQLEALS